MSEVKSLTWSMKSKSAMNAVKSIWKPKRRMIRSYMPMPFTGKAQYAEARRDQGDQKKYGLTQGEMSRLLGWGGATVSRYENGALQDKTHDNQLKLLRDPRNMRVIISENPDALREHRRMQYWPMSRNWR